MKDEKQICIDKSDSEIIDLSSQDIKYFACLYDRYEIRLLRYIKKISNLNSAEAEDILQEAFIKAWVNLNGFDRDLAFSSWIYRIVHNETISTIRKKKSYGKNKTIELNDDILQIDEEDSDSENKETLEVTSQLIHQLPLKYQEVLLLKFYEKMNYEEISDVLKIPEGTVAVRINRAKKQLKKLIEKSNNNQ